MLATTREEGQGDNVLGAINGDGSVTVMREAQGDSDDSNSDNSDSDNSDSDDSDKGWVMYIVWMHSTSSLWGRPYSDQEKGGRWSGNPERRMTCAQSYTGYKQEGKPGAMTVSEDDSHGDNSDSDGDASDASNYAMYIYNTAM
jgi:hypothetical protein